jgi:hypothetical protein
MEVNTARQPLMLESSVSLVFSPSKTRYYVLVKSSLRWGLSSLQCPTFETCLPMAWLPGASILCRRHVQIIKVDPISGALKFTCTYGKDMFPTEVGQGAVA